MKLLLTSFFLTLCLSAGQRCSKVDFDVRGRQHKEHGITEYTAKYGEVKQRWDAAKLVPLTSDANLMQRGAKCPQMQCLACGWKPKFQKTEEGNIAQGPSSVVEGEEQCLYLSAFAPAKGEDDYQGPSPTVFHVHHGQLLYGFKTGLGEVKKVVQQGLMVANANFRLGVLGFLAHPDADMGNVGQHDLIVALQWLQRYICNFGGDPGRVTITGSSTGAAAVALLLASKAAVGLFHNAWMNSITSFGSPDFFSEDIPSVFEHSTKPQMLSVGCGTLKCMKEYRLVNLFFDLRMQDSPLVVLSPDVTAKMPTYSWMAFDGLTIPNMFEVARTSRFASNKVPIIVGQALNEMDTLKFQFPLRRMLTNLIKDRLQSDGKDDAYSCIERKLLGSQGLQETAEDFMFNLGSYLAATRPAHQESGPRWHFLITAPASINGRSWHTQAELLSWGPDMSEDSSQYDHLSKQFVLGKAPVELRRYGHKQFINFVKTGQPADKNWLPTNTGAPGKLAGLPSKLYDTSPLAGNMHNQHSHSNHTITLLHDLLFDNSESKLLSDLEMHNCKENLRKTNSELEALRQNLTVYKKTDLIFALEIIRQANPLSMLAEKVLNTGELPDMGEFVGGDDA